ncbi:MAG: hypothetical protein H6712_27555 [Myxococcales bacterium]|nr:hypothetical protein [Myxococcales bacterium]MCB9717635.1 hypothetical protein [Myxococcales bacterium]
MNGWSRGCHDPSAALLRDGELVCAVEEERLLRRKHALDRLPHLAIDYCLGAAGITAAEIDHVAVGWDGNHLLAYSTGRPHAQASEGVLREVYLPHSLFPERGDRAMPVTCVDHHRAHAAGAFAASGFREALVVVIDGSGEYESTTLLRASAGGRLELLRRYPFSCSIGLLYDALTLYLGFGRFHHGKVMGLAAHGTPRFELPDLDLDAEAPPRDPARRDHEQAVVDHWLRTFESLTGRGTLTHPRTRQVDDGLRRSDASEPSAQHRDLAASAQAWLEQQVCRLVRHGVALCGLHDVVITGGVGLSCPANFRVLGLPEVDRVYVPSAPGDAGVSLGAACAVSWAAGVEPRLDDAHCYAGPSASDAQVAALLRRCGLTALQVDEPARVVADELLRGRVVAWFHDGLELGPRALGHRSILASPLELETRHRVNRIKGREPWRPLAPSVLAESTTDHFEGDPHSPFMSFSAPVREATARRAPAIVHEDGTARLQTVHRDTTPAFWTAIDAFGRDSGLPIVMNTSFNVGPEPLVCSPLDALRTFWASGLDTLVLESFVLRKDG